MLFLKLFIFAAWINLLVFGEGNSFGFNYGTLEGGNAAGLRGINYLGGGNYVPGYQPNWGNVGVNFGNNYG